MIRSPRNGQQISTGNRKCLLLAIYFSSLLLLWSRWSAAIMSILVRLYNSYMGDYTSRTCNDYGNPVVYLHCQLNQIQSVRGLSTLVHILQSTFVDCSCVCGCLYCTHSNHHNYTHQCHETGNVVVLNYFTIYFCSLCLH